ncbi:UNKNOWN [Stylonychia lemnae]|uniref:Uncharacterized protein n=1 Tax=Stylonychia lemnae TaxID=5949 RepID=A0A078BAZ8_STYLE|nr:UNKNOWN [Stylonychia lemnae]|eukprot:CDW91569.1 UNKNOWN [Stylonychia lemnae]
MHISVKSRFNESSGSNSNFKLGELIKQLSRNIVVGEDKERIFLQQKQQSHQLQANNSQPNLQKFHKQQKQLMQTSTSFGKSQNGQTIQNQQQTLYSSLMGDKKRSESDLNQQYFGKYPDMSDKLFKLRSKSKAQEGANTMTSGFNTEFSEQDVKQMFQLPKLAYKLKREAEKTAQQPKEVSKIEELNAMKIELKKSQSQLNMPRFYLLKE